MKINWASMGSLCVVCLGLGYSLSGKMSFMSLALMGAAIGFVWGMVWPTVEK